MDTVSIAPAALYSLLGSPRSPLVLDVRKPEAFADEIFRVFANAHPEVELIHVHAVSEVQQMIRRAEVLRDEQGGQLPLLK